MWAQLHAQTHVSFRNRNLEIIFIRGTPWLLTTLKIKPQVAPMAYKARHDLVTDTIFNLIYHHSFPLLLQPLVTSGYSSFRPGQFQPWGLWSWCSCEVLFPDIYMIHSLMSFMPLWLTAPKMPPIIPPPGICTLCELLHLSEGWT